MSTHVHESQVFKHPMIQELGNAFSHLPSVKQAFQVKDLTFLLGCSPSLLINGEISFEEYFVRNILKKVQNLDVDGIDPTANALNKFSAFLDDQDLKVHGVSHMLYSLDTTTSVGRVLFKARDILHDAFKGFSGVDLEPRFTAGSTTELTRLQGSNPFNRVKASSGWDIVNDRLSSFFSEDGFTTFDMLDYLPGIPGDNTFHVDIECVPKQWDIDRVIGKQPTTVLAWQAAVGDWMTNRASRVGLHIPTAQEIHKRIARENSLDDGPMMTLDQSNASDNILRCLVEFLLPRRLYHFLDAITPRYVQINGVKRHVHMMAPAGNGYIFPLQTLIFWALASATCFECGVKGKVYSYGDDLIAPKAIATQLGILFANLGLQINANKTFISGHFRESCGGDYLLGGDVRPFYAKYLPTTTLEWIRCVNGIRRVGWYNNLNDWRTNNFRRFWLWCIAHIPANDRLFAPRHYGDAAINHECESLYKLTFKRAYYRDGIRYKYPNGGIHESGHPYSGWYIETYVHQSTGKGVTFNETVRGVSSRNVMRVIPLASVKGSGIVKHLKRNEVSMAYPSFFERDEYVVRRIVTPYFQGPPAPSEDMAALFGVLSPDNPIRDVDAVVRRGQDRYDNAILKLVSVLRVRAAQLEVVLQAASNLEMNF